MAVKDRAEVVRRPRSISSPPQAMMRHPRPLRSSHRAGRTVNKPDSNQHPFGIIDTARALVSGFGGAVIGGYMGGSLGGIIGFAMGFMAVIISVSHPPGSKF